MEWIQEKKERPEAIRPFDRDTVARRHEEIRLLHTYNSNAIKGNTLTPYETKPVLDEGIRNGVAWHATRRALAQYIQKHGLK